MRPSHLLFLTAAAGVILAGCGGGSSPGEGLDATAEAYVRLVLAVGRHDPNYVDAYYGPKAWKEDADRGDPVPLHELLSRTRDLLARVRAACGR